MKPLQVVFGIIIVTLIVGCETFLYSLNEIHTKGAVVFEESILGKWGDDENNTSLIFKKAEDEDGVYYVEIIDGDLKITLQGHLVKLGENHFLDLYGNDEKLEELFNKNLTILPFHLIVKIDWEDNLLRIWCFDEDIDWLGEEVIKRMEENIFSVEFDLLNPGNNRIPVTICSTEQVQKFLIRYGGDERAFPKNNISEFKRFKGKDES